MKENVDTPQDQLLTVIAMAETFASFASSSADEAETGFAAVLADWSVLLPGGELNLRNYLMSAATIIAELSAGYKDLLDEISEFHYEVCDDPECMIAGYDALEGMRKQILDANGVNPFGPGNGSE